MDLQNIQFQDVYLIKLAQERSQWMAVVNTVRHHLLPGKTGHFLANSTTTAQNYWVYGIYLTPGILNN
jgi:hypothetical protein